MLQKGVVVGPFHMNCWIIACPETGLGAMIDPGDDVEDILAAVKGLKTQSGAPIDVRYLIHTHAHLDHIGATREIREHFPNAKILLHQDDEPLWQQLKSQGEMFGFNFKDPLPVDQLVSGGEKIALGTLTLQTIHTPGHSPGGLCVLVSEAGGTPRLFSGDTLFQGSVGRTDLWGGNMDVLAQSIREKLFVLPEDTRVFPGHGPETRIGIEKRQNPFVR